MEALFLWLLASGWVDLAIGFFLKCLLFVLAYGAMRLILRLLDKVVNINFQDWIDQASSMDKAIYFGFRFLGTAIMAGMIFM